MAVTHQKVSTVPDGADTSVVRPSDWNADHAGISNGSFTILAGSASKVVSHGLAGTPKVFWSADSYIIGKITNKSATQFTFTMDAPQDADVAVDWMAVL